MKTSIETKTSFSRLEEACFKSGKIVICSLTSFDRYLLDLLVNDSEKLHDRLHSEQMSADAQEKLRALHLRSLHDLKTKREQVSFIVSCPKIIYNYYQC